MNFIINLKSDLKNAFSKLLQFIIENISGISFGICITNLVKTIRFSDGKSISLILFNLIIDTFFMLKFVNIYYKLEK